MIASRKPLTFRKALLNGLVSAFTLVSLCVGAVLLPALFSNNTPPVAAPYSGQDNLGREHAPGSVAGLMEANDCWTGEAPADMAGVIPGHAIVHVEGEPSPRIGGPRIVSRAMAQVFNGTNSHLTIHAFCR